MTAAPAVPAAYSPEGGTLVYEVVVAWQSTADPSEPYNVPPSVVTSATWAA